VLECGPYRRETSLEGLGEREVTRSAFIAFAELVDDSETDPDTLAEFMAVTIVETGQLWIYPADVFLQNLASRRGEQAKARRALERLAAQDTEPASESEEESPDT
jgi:hypothetical protein